MPLVKVWGLPKLSEEELRRVHHRIVRAVVSVTELDVRDEKDVTCLFPADMMCYGRGTEIIVEVTVHSKTLREVQDILAKRIGQEVWNLFSHAKIECLVIPFNPSKGGFWVRKRS